MSAGPVVGFVGLGRMGAPRAANVARAGFPLVVHDRRPEAAEPLVAEGARWAADAADIIMVGKTDRFFTNT